jgi:hypothetical protein
MDCTYKMNRFKMPLLHIVSFACTGATFTSAIVFLSAETIKDYEWALNTYKGFMGNYLPLAIVTDQELALMRATKIAFPITHKMLYRWHICKNVMAKHRTGFTEEDWQTFMTLFSGVMRAGTEASCRRSWCRFKRSGWVPSRVLCSMCFPGCNIRHILLVHMLTKCHISSRHPHHVWKAHTQR